MESRTSALTNKPEFEETKDSSATVPQSESVRTAGSSALQQTRLSKTPKDDVQIRFEEEKTRSRTLKTEFESWGIFFSLFMRVF